MLKLNNFLSIFFITIYLTILNAEQSFNGKVQNSETDDVFNFTVNHTSTNTSCLMARFSASFLITYKAKMNQTVESKTVTVNLTKPSGYSGFCGEKNDTLNIKFGRDWMLSMTYSLSNDYYSLTSVKLIYVIESNIFENATELGKKEAANSELNQFNVNTGKSYKCYAKTSFVITPDVSIEFRNYQAQAFIKNDTTNVGFDTAVECFADIAGSNKLVPIVIGIVLTVLIVLVIVAYVVGRRRYRPTYQQV